MRKQKFDLVSALNVIAIEEDLSKMFTEKFPFTNRDSFSKLIQNAEKGKIDAAKSNFVKGTYENVILARPAFQEKYNAFFAKSPEAMKLANKAATVEANKIKAQKEADIKKRAEERAAKAANSTGRSTLVKLPKEYNKKIVDAEFKARGDGKYTELELTVLSLNELKNLRALLNKRCSAQHFRGTEELTLDDMLVIRAAVSQIKKKLNPIAKRTKK